MSKLTMISLSQLNYGRDAAKGSIDSRKTATSVVSLANSIKQHGLLVPLVVIANGEDKFDVMDGNRRLEALRQIHGKTSDEKVGCVLHAPENPLELSMVCNVEREGLHPVDRFEVFAALVQAGETVEVIGKRYGMKVPQIRQALALGKMAPEVRDAWREGKLDAEVAEAFTVTSDHKAQVMALKRAGKHPTQWEVRRALVGNDDHPVETLLAIVGKDAYEKAGHQVNESLFHEERGSVTVSDLPALKQMVAERIDGRCAELKAEGWKWAINKSEAPQDVYAWRRVTSENGKYTKESMATMGCLVGIANFGGATLQVERGVVKPGDSVKLPKSAKQKKVEAKVRAEKKEETGGLTNALAERLGKQLTAAVRASIASAPADLVVSLVVAALASGESPSRISLGTIDDDARDADFGKYLKLMLSKTPSERARVLATWFAKSVRIEVHSAPALASLMEEDKAAVALLKALPRVSLQADIGEAFDAEDFFNTASRDLILEAVKEMKKDNLVAANRMKVSELRVWAIKNIKNWVPKALRVV